MGELGVDDSNKGGKDRGEWEGRSLRAHNRARKQALSADEVLAKQLGHDVLDVRDIDLVDHTVDALAERIPAQTLVLWRALVLARLGLHGAQARGRDVSAAGTRAEHVGELRLGDLRAGTAATLGRSGKALKRR